MWVSEVYREEVSEVWVSKVWVSEVYREEVSEVWVSEVYREEVSEVYTAPRLVTIESVSHPSPWPPPVQQGGGVHFHR